MWAVLRWSHGPWSGEGVTADVHAQRAQQTARPLERPQFAGQEATEDAFGVVQIVGEDRMQRLRLGGHPVAAHFPSLTYS